MSTQPLALPQPPYGTPMTDQNGLVSQAWRNWFQQLYIRVGGAQTAPIANINSLPIIQLISAPAPAVNTILYTAPVGQKAVVNSFQVSNSDIVAHNVSVWFVPLSQTANASNIVVNAVSIPAGQSVVFSALQYQVIAGGGTIQVLGVPSNVLVVQATGRITS